MTKQPKTAWPPELRALGYDGQVVHDTETNTTMFAWSKNGDLDPFRNPEQIGRLPPPERCSETPEACIAAAWADARATQAN